MTITGSGTPDLSAALSSDEISLGTSFIHPQALCESAAVGPRTRIWAFAHVLPGATIGADCNICDGVFIENDVRIANRVTVKCGVQLWDGVSLEDDVFVGPNATFTNDKFPRSRALPDAFLTTVVRRGASIGANATILPGVEIGAGAMVGAGAVVTRSLPANAIAVGNPAQIVGYMGTERQAPTAATAIDVASADIEIGVRGVSLHEMPLIRDIRGSLSVGEFSAGLPFQPQRYFVVFDVPNREVRGEHAHRQCQQLMVCVRGSCAVLVDDGMSRAEVVLDRPNIGLYLPPLVWGTQYRYSADAMLLVFASHPYEGNDYIRSYEEFLAVVASTA
jgi:UDP-2-acetamido-3-amino-2,3-dideoxy-glucuronate N-acetyltransferase